VVIRVLFVLLVLCTAALVAVGIAVLLRVRRHYKQEHSDVQGRAALDKSAEETADEDRS
jgi:cell division protein FtsX